MDDEQSLIARAQRGDLYAYEALVRQYEQVAFRAAYLVSQNEDEAAETAQDAFLRAHRAIGTFQLGRPFRPWLLRIVTTQALNRVQAAQRRERMVERYTRRVVNGADMRTPEQAVSERERSERLLRLVRRLSRDEQMLISLRYFLELPEAELAETLHIPRGTVKSRLHRTLAKLRDLIQREASDLGEFAT